MPEVAEKEKKREKRRRKKRKTFARALPTHQRLLLSIDYEYALEEGTDSVSIYENLHGA